MLTLDQVRLTPYDATDKIPEGFKIAGDFKTRRGPSPMQHNWYSRWDSIQHEVFHKLATSLQTKPEGYTLDELKAPYPDEDKPKVDELINRFKGSWDHRHTGFDLVMTDGPAESTRYMLIWRDPRVFYAKEIGLEGDFSQVPFQKTPTYVEKVPQLIEEARNPKPPAAEKAPKADAAPKAPKATKAPKAADTSAAPTGGFLAAFANVPATLAGVEGNTLGEILSVAIARFVEPEAKLVAPDDVNVSVAERLTQVIDQSGLEGGLFVDFVARYQKMTSIKAGFYRICKDLAKIYAAHVKAAGTAAPAPPAAPPAEPVAEQQPVAQ